MSDTIEKTEDDLTFQTKFIDKDSDPKFVAAYDHFIASASQAFLVANFTCPGFSEMTESEKLQTLVNGTLAGIISLMMSKLRDEYADTATDYVRECVGPASINAKNLIEDWKRKMAQMVRESDGMKPEAKLN